MESAFPAELKLRNDERRSVRNTCSCPGCDEEYFSMDDKQETSRLNSEPCSSGFTSDNFLRRDLFTVDTASLPSRVVFNVGGQMFETSTDTILKDQNSYFSALLVKQPLEEGQPYFIDRDGSRFPYVLNYLRNGTIHTNDLPTLEAIHEESMYFQLQPLQAACAERMRNLHERMEADRKDIADACAKALVTAMTSYGGGQGDLDLELRIRSSGGRGRGNWHRQGGLDFHPEGLDF